MIMLIIVEMPTIVSILTFISMTNTILESFKASFFIFGLLEFHAQLS